MRSGTTRRRKIVFPEILVGKDQVRMPGGIAGQGSVNVEHAGEFPPPCRSGNRSERVGLRRHSKIFRSSLKQKVEIGGHDRRCTAAVRKTDERAVDWRRASGAGPIGVV